MATFTRIITLLFVLSMLWPMMPAQASPELPTIDLEVGLRDISKVQIGFHHSSFESTHSEYDLSVRGSSLSDGKQTIPLASLSPLLKHLHGLYPSTDRLFWLKWTDDYPKGWANLHLKDGRIIVITSESQYRNMLPWDVMVFENEQAHNPTAVYLLLNPELPAALSAIWEPLAGSKYPRGDGDTDHWSPFDELSQPDIETAEFYSAGRSNWDNPASDQAEVLPWNPAALQPFVPLLARNAEIDRLFRSGFTLFDADFTVTVSTTDFTPQKYAGMFALRSPDGKDAVVSTVSIPIDPGEPVVTALTSAQAEKLIAGRKSQPFLERAAALLPSLVFLLDTRSDKPQPNFPNPEYACVENSTFSEPAEILPALLHSRDYTQLNFFHFPEQNTWSVDLDLEKGDSNWDEATVKTVLEQWFPPEFASLAPEDLQKVSTHWGIAFNPDVTIDQPDLLTRIQTNLPPEVKIHLQNPEKDGDYTYLSLEGRPIIGETGSMQQLIHCGKLIPKWVTAPYPIDKIPLPNSAAPRSNLSKPSKSRTGWGSLWFTMDKRRFASITGSDDGYVYLVWSTEDKFYYAEGWANGAGWTEPLDLGPEGWSPDIYSFPNGEIHILWPELNPDGSVHLWRSKDQQWHKAERWPEMGYFQKIIQGSDGRLHMIWKGTDGLDQELMYAEWDAESGLTQPENISRRIGGIGNVDVDLMMSADGKFCAAWGHTLEQKSAPDAVTGEIADISGVFFACRDAEGHWDMPEQIGQLAPYAHAVQVAIDSQGTSLVAWQSDEGLVSRRRVDGAWQDVQLIATVQAPETPAEFGPERAVRPTADVLLVASPDGKIFAGWSTAAVGIQLSIWDGSDWETPLPVMNIPSTEGLTSFTMALDQAGRPHLVYFKGAGLTHAVYENGSVLTEDAGGSLGGYGSITPQLTIAGDFLYVIGDPKNSRFYTYIPPNSALPTPLPTPTRTPKVTPTLRPTRTPLPSSTPQSSATAAPTAGPTPTPVQQHQNPRTTFWWGIGGAGVVVIAWVVYRSRRKDQGNTNTQSP